MSTTIASTKIFIGNLHWSLDDDAFKTLLASTGGTVLSAKVAVPPRRPEDKNKGFGFGEYSTHREAEQAIAALHHSEHLGRKLLASWAGQPRAPNGHRTPPYSLAVPVAQPSSNQGGPSSAPLNPGDPHAQSPPNIYHVPGNEALIDIGANLASHKFNHSTSALLSRAAQAGISHIIITGTSVPASQSAISLITKFDPRPHQERKHTRVRLYSTAGVHPHDASNTLKQYPDYIDRLEKLILDHPGVVVSVGECGLDYDRMFSTKEDQKSVFRAQMDLAKKHDLPVFLHCRDSPHSSAAHSDFISILRSYPTVRKCVHCYTDPSPRHMQDLLALDCYIGITGWIADPRRGVDLADLVARREIPMGRLMIETDAPFLIPLNRPKVAKENSAKGKKSTREMNEPALLGWVAKKVAECLEMTVEELAKETTATAKDFFMIA